MKNHCPSDDLSSTIDVTTHFGKAKDSSLRGNGISKSSYAVGGGLSNALQEPQKITSKVLAMPRALSPRTTSFSARDLFRRRILQPLPWQVTNCSGDLKMRVSQLNQLNYVTQGGFGYLKRQWAEI